MVGHRDASQHRTHPRIYSAWMTATYLSSFDLAKRVIQHTPMTGMRSDSRFVLLALGHSKYNTKYIKSRNPSKLINWTLDFSSYRIFRISVPIGIIEAVVLIKIWNYRSRKGCMYYFLFARRHYFYPGKGESNLTLAGPVFCTIERTFHLYFTMKLEIGHHVLWV